MNATKRTELEVFYETFINKVRAKTIDDETAAELALFYKVFGDGTRLKILSALLYGELRVYDICEILNLKQSTVSQQMKTLRQMRLVKARHEGKNIYYELDDEHIEKIFIMGLEHAKESKK